MRFNEIINARESKELDRPLMRKESFPVSEGLQKYLREYGRDIELPIAYKDLLNYRHTTALRNKAGKLTHWETAVYDLKEMEFLKQGLIQTYAVLKTEGDLSFTKHLDVARIDFCEFGNSVPFRIRIVNRINDNYDHYYIKDADSSRIYGLELEHLLSPNRITFLYHKNTLIEEHIAGIPGDTFLDDYLPLPETNKIRIAKEFVKFNERCFTRLLGDMRAYNFVIEITHDIEDFQYRIRAIDFDQQCYEGRKNLYLPQFYKENYEYVQLVLKTLSPDVIFQYQTEERVAMANRVWAGRKKLMELLGIMAKDELSQYQKVKQLREELNEHFKTTYFSKCNRMGAILKRQLKISLQEYLKLIKKA
ncbi:MAG: hypothetical protein IT254_11220 [Chitinophagaceae bacterium]|nr:hypothetical protein [Chitinophagaceae bacterium]MCW5916792.1 hypothetical protein [Ferruginibacter sp.]